MGQTGTTSWISIKGILLAAAAIVAIVIAAVAALLLLRPNPPQQTTAQQAPTAATNAAPGAVGSAAPSGPLLRGTYNAQNTFVSSTITIASDCPTCDATVTGNGRTGLYRWTGNGWTFAEDCRTETVTPTVVVNGFVQEVSTHAWGCGAASNTGTWTRVGD